MVLQNWMTGACWLWASEQTKKKSGKKGKRNFALFVSEHGVALWLFLFVPGHLPHVLPSAQLHAPLSVHLE
jgi:hypothetical protein